MIRTWMKLLILITGLIHFHAIAETPLTVQEQNWIKNHRQVSYTVASQWPQEFIKDGKHIGLSREVLDDVAKRTGLQFVYISPEQALLEPPMMISSINGTLLSEEERKRWLLTFPWLNIMPIIVSKDDATQVRTLQQLKGKRVVVVASADYLPWLRQHHPEILLDVEPDALTALQTVEEGKNVAAIVGGPMILPILQGRYSNHLAIVAQIAEMASGINMAVDPAYPELRSILDKTMENTTARDAQSMFIQWVTMFDIGTPRLSLFLWHYRYPLIIIGILLLLLLFSLRSAWRAKRRAQRSEQDKSDFLAMMSHEIRTPMNAIIAALELLRFAGKSTQRQEYVELAYSSSQNLLELLNDVLEHEKIAQRQLALQPVPTNISSLLEAISDSHRPAIRKKELALLLSDSLTEENRWLMIDANRLRQIINNLLSNAIKFTHHGAIELHVERLGDDLQIIVADSGVGIRPELQHRLFSAWEQGKHQAGGSGLGLFICRSLVTLMHGEIRLQSQPDKGTTITVTLPAKTCLPNIGVESGLSQSLPAMASHFSLLVVEDHPANRQLLAEQLDILGCQYELAEDGETALQRIQDENYYDLILLDCGLPGMDGYEVAMHIREEENRQQRDAMPIIAISAQHSPQHRERCLQSSMNDVLTKPIRLSDLATVLERWGGLEKVAPASSPTPALTSDVWLALQEDIAAFDVAIAHQMRREMLHHIHRINGVALMYELLELAAFAGELESNLRAELPPEQWQQQVWIQQLNQLSQPR